MSQLIMPQRKQSPAMGALGTLAGAGIGALVPGAGAATIGLGASLGGAGGNLLSQGQGGGQQQVGIPSSSGESSAMARRSQQQSQDNLAVLQQAEQQLPQLPESLRQQYAPAIIQARYMEERNRGMA